MASDAFFRERGHQYLAAWSPHRHGLGERRDIVDPGDANLIDRSLRDDPAPLDQAAALIRRVVVPHRGADPEAQQQPVDLLRELL